MKEKISAILLAGGKGSRMQTETPKQFLNLCGKPMIAHSLDFFMQRPDIFEIIVICDLFYQELIQKLDVRTTLKFARPGKRRQDSVYHGFVKINPDSTLVCIHDAARPLINTHILEATIEAAREVGAAAAAVPLKFTVKEVDALQRVIHTPNRDYLWEVQTPQIIRPHLLESGFKKAFEDHLTVTDDVSLVELLGNPVKLTRGCYTNIKVTTCDDLLLATQFINMKNHHV